MMEAQTIWPRQFADGNLSPSNTRTDRSCSEVVEEVPLPHPANARLAARLVARLVGTKTGTPEARILANDRGKSGEARSRQITMYLLHTSLSLSYTEIAEALFRDRTTVSHACRLIEDGRDNGALNAMLCELEGILELIGPLAGFRWSQTANR